MKPNNLDTFRILFLVKGILTLMFSIFFIIYACMGFFFSAAIETNELNEMPFNPGIIFVIIGGIGIIISVTLGTLTLVASKYIKQRKNYTFIFVIAVLNCLTGILGILLGVFTLIELNKPEIKALFGKE